MASIFKNVRLFVGEYNLSGDLNEMALSYKAEIKDATNGLSQAREKLAGLTDWTASVKGMVNLGTNLLDEVIFGKIGLNDQVLSAFPNAAAAGDIGYFGKVDEGEYVPGGKIGDLFLFDVKAEGTGILVRGLSLANATQASSGTGTAVNAGAVGATQKLYAALHVLAVSGTNTPTLTVKVQSDDAQAFLSAVDQITFSPATAVGAQFAAPVDGPITDAWWRANWGITGTNPSFTFILAMGIQ